MRRSRILLGTLIALTIVAGCFTGPSASGFTPAVSGHGADAQLHIGRTRLDGELLELRDSAYVLVNGDGIFLVPFSIVDKASFDHLGSYSGGAPGPEWAERLRLVSRFPQGMPDRAIAMLLGAAHQSELHLVKR
jgi:hypothetical protein